MVHNLTQMITIDIYIYTIIWANEIFNGNRGLDNQSYRYIRCTGFCCIINKTHVIYINY